MIQPITPEMLARAGSEDAHQKALFCFAASNARHYDNLRWLFAIPNGGSRNVIEAAKLKATGVKSGVPDICLPVARRGFHGLFIELKRPGSLGKLAGTPSEEQLNWMKFLQGEGYACKVAYGWEQARDFLLEYLE